MSGEEKLSGIRVRIDSIDQQIQQLINDRARCAQEVAAVKMAAGESEDFYRPEREAQVLRQVYERNSGPLSSTEITRLFREIMSTCLALEYPLKTAYLGPEGTYTQQALLKHFGSSVETQALASIPDIFHAVECGDVQYGVVPVENSTAGTINHTLDMFMQSTLRICGEVDLRVQHSLLSNGDMVGLKQVYAHPQALAQCQQWLDRNLPDVKRVPMSSNAEAARCVINKRDSAAIAAESASLIYDLDVLSRSIEDEQSNTTRFLILGNKDIAASGKDKTSILVSLKNEPGALNNLLEPIARNNLSMTRIESRPSGQGMWDYVFFIDIEGHRNDERVASALKDLKARASLLKILGSYPLAVI